MNKNMVNFIRTTSSKWNTVDKTQYKDSIVFIEDTQQIYVNGNYYGRSLYEQYKDIGGTLSENIFPTFFKYFITPFMISNGSSTIIPDDLLNSSGTNFITEYYWQIMRLTGGEPIMTIQWNGNIPHKFKGISSGREYSIDFSTKTITPL